MNHQNDMQQLTHIATIFREALDHVTSGFIIGAFNKFPKECGGDACDLLQHYLLHVHNIKTDYRMGKVQISSRSAEIAHCYLFINGIIIDITADQFNTELFPRVIVCDSSEYPLTVHFKYISNKSDRYLSPLNHYLESIYKQVIRRLESKY